MSLPKALRWEDLRALRRREIETADYLLAYGNLSEKLDHTGSDERMRWEDYRDAWIDVPTSAQSGLTMEEVELPASPVYKGGIGFTPTDQDMDFDAYEADEREAA